ncbi:hypothetical protein ZWY2020_046128 [Hordeum vulgare]|nr:hypothetical protein ZWY2020_046128 [Hordeum vulgare]
MGFPRRPPPLPFPVVPPPSSRAGAGAARATFTNPLRPYRSHPAVLAPHPTPSHPSVPSLPPSQRGMEKAELAAHSPSTSSTHVYKRLRLSLQACFARKNGNMDHATVVPSLAYHLLDQMTNGFSEDRELGRGTYGKVYLVHRNWRNRLQAASVNALESYCIQVKRCIEMALSCVEVDRHKRPTIGNILNELNETETASQFADALLKDPESTTNQESQQTHITEVEEKREREQVRETENCFGEVVDNYRLDKMARYMGKHKAREDRAREAWNLVDEHDKDNKASNFWHRNKAYCGISDIDWFQNNLEKILYIISDADYSSSHRSGGCEIEAKIGRGHSPKFTARISYR